MSEIKVTLERDPWYTPWPWVVTVIGPARFQLSVELCMTRRGAKRWARRKIRSMQAERKVIDITDEVTE